MKSSTLAPESDSASVDGTLSAWIRNSFLLYDLDKITVVQIRIKQRSRIFA